MKKKEPCHPIQYHKNVNMRHEKYFSDSVDLPPSWVHEVNAQNMLRFPWERIGGTIGCQWTLDCTWKRCYWTVCHRTKLYDDFHSVGHLLFQTGIDSEKKKEKKYFQYKLCLKKIIEIYKRFKQHETLSSIKRFLKFIEYFHYWYWMDRKKNIWF